MCAGRTRRARAARIGGFRLVSYGDSNVDNEFTVARSISAQLLADKPLEYQLLLKERALASSAEGITISDPSQPDNPIIYANSGFERLTGYSVDDVLGKNCRFLQGPDTDPETVDQIREAIRTQSAVSVELLNYRKDGSTFWNRLSITPVRDEASNTTHFIGIQSDVTARREAEHGLREANDELAAVGERMKNDLEAAARLQRALLPPQLPDLKGVKVAWTFKPCDELAGDFLNVFPLDDERIAIYVVDVSGHGVAASLLSVTIGRILTPRVSSSSLLQEHDGVGGIRVVSPARVAGELNTRFPMEDQNGLSFTLLYGILDIKKLEFRFVSAGHEPIVHQRRDGETQLVYGDGMTIGWMEDLQYEDHVLKLQPGDRIYLYSDGVPEAMDPGLNEFTMDRMLDQIRCSRSDSIEAVVHQVCDRVVRWCQPAGPRDDISIIGVEV